MEGYFTVIGPRMRNCIFGRPSNGENRSCIKQAAEQEALDQFPVVYPIRGIKDRMQQKRTIDQCLLFLAANWIPYPLYNSWTSRVG